MGERKIERGRGESLERKRGLRGRGCGRERKGGTETERDTEKGL